MNTKWLPKKSSADIKQRLRSLNWLEILALVGLGLIIATVQANLHWRLGLPGWRGLIWLTPLVATRLSTSRFGAASITSLSATGFTWLFGVESNPFDWFFYLVVGELLDLAYHQGKKWRRQVWFWAVAAGLIHLIKPVTRMIISAGGVWSYGFLSSGFIYPLTTHLLFGAIAGLVGAGAVLWIKRRRSAKLTDEES